FHQIEEITTDLFGGELSFITTGPRLFETNGGALSFGTDDNRLQVKEVAVFALVIKGFNADVPFALVDGDLGSEIGVLEPAKAPLSRLGPELAVFGPTKPISGPTGFGVGGEGNRTPEAVLPVSQNRVAFIRDEGKLGAAFGRRANVSE